MTLNNRNASFLFVREGLAVNVMRFPYGRPALRANSILSKQLCKQWKIVVNS